MPRPNKNKLDSSTDELIGLPSLAYVFGCLRRQFLFASLFTLPVILVLILALSQFPLEYASELTVQFDTSDNSTGDSSKAENPATIASRISNSFLARFSDRNFIIRIMQRLPLEPDTDDIEQSSRLRSLLQKILPTHLQPALWSLPEETQWQLQTAEAVERALTPTARAAQFTLSLKAKAENPEDAQALVRTSMDQFIVDELNQRITQAKARLAELSALEATVLREKETTTSLNQTLTAEKPEIDASSEEKQTLKAKEQKLVLAVLAKKSELDRAKTSQETRILTLQDQLNNLLSRRGPTHPEVIQKQREIDKAKTEPLDIPIESAYEALKTQLVKIQSQMRLRGTPIDRSIQIASFNDETRRSLNTISEQLRNVEGYRNELERELKKPAESSLFLTIGGPELPVSPSNLKIFLLAGGVGLILSAACFALAILLRELRQPHLVASEQLSKSYGIDPTAEVEAAWLKKFPLLLADEIRELRPQLGKQVMRKRHDLKLFDTYRHIGQLVEHEEPHQVVLVLDTSASDHDDNLAANLTKVLSVDSGRRVLFLSFRGRSSGGEENTMDLMQFLAGQAEWKDVRFKGSVDGYHDTAYARDPLEYLGSFREELIQRLFKGLREKYQIIVVEGFPPAFTTENGILNQMADKLVLQIRLGETRHEDLERMLLFVDLGKISASLIS